MKISELIALIDTVKPNAYPADLKVAWLNEVEGMVWTDIMLLSPLEFKAYSYNANTGEGDIELLVAIPHSKLYNVYLAAMIDFYNGEYDRYHNSITLFNAYFSEFSRWYAMHYRPADGDYGYMGIYISAYGIAVKHGFVGTEEEWLESLKGSGGGDIDEETIRELIDEFLENNPIDAPVTSVNGKTGAVRLNASDVGARPSDWMPSASDVGALTSATLNNAIDDALAQAKASGEFDGEDGRGGEDGTDGKDGYTPVKGVDYFDGADGVDGVGIREVKQTTSSSVSGGKNVVTVYLTNGSSYTFTVYNGQKGADGEGGGGGGTGEDGVSVSDAAINENGELVLYLSNGDEINVGRVVGSDGKDGVDGKDGTNGKDGTSVTVKSVTNNTGDGQTNTVTFSDGKTLQVKNGSKGNDGGIGERGTKVFYVDYPQLTPVSGTIGNVNPHYSLPISTLTVGNPNIGAPLAGDFVLHENTNLYAVLLIRNDTVYLDAAVNIKGYRGIRGSKILRYNGSPNGMVADLENGFTCSAYVYIDDLIAINDVDTVLVNDIVWHHTYFRRVGYVDEVRAYLGEAVSIKGDTGAQGPKGDTGATGKEGKTPVKGTDYWTASDKAGIVSDVLSALPTWNGGSY